MLAVKGAQAEPIAIGLGRQLKFRMGSGGPAIVAAQTGLGMVKVEGNKVTFFKFIWVFGSGDIIGGVVVGRNINKRKTYHQ